MKAVHYLCASGDHYYRELDSNLTMEDVQRIVSGDLMTAQMLLLDPILESEAVNVWSIPREHPDWEKFLGEKWSITEASPEAEGS